MEGCDCYRSVSGRLFSPLPTFPPPLDPLSHTLILFPPLRSLLSPSPAFSSDKIAAALRVHLNAPDLTTAQVLESATWKGGREIAKQLRGDKGSGPPIEIVSDGTVF